jgi:hypothetical protein
MHVDGLVRLPGILRRGYIFEQSRPVKCTGTSCVASQAPPPWHTLTGPLRAPAGAALGLWTAPNH